jgi:RNA polymerase sigma-70 factor (ECF subfamily)
MLPDDVKLDLVAKLRKQGGSEVGEYCTRYAACERWAFAAVQNATDGSGPSGPI